MVNLEAITVSFKSSLNLDSVIPKKLESESI